MNDEMGRRKKVVTCSTVLQRYLLGGNEENHELDQDRIHA